MTENNTTEGLSEKDLADLDALSNGQAPSFHPILEVWKKVLEPLDTERHEKVTPQFASRITASYRGIEFGDMNEYRDRYFDKLAELRDVLHAELETDEDYDKPESPEEDLEHNSRHYRQLLLDWQKVILRWELEWECTAPDAAIELAAISEAHKMFFGQTGITDFLQHINFQFTDAEQAEIHAELEGMKGGTSE